MSLSPVIVAAKRPPGHHDARSDRQPCIRVNGGQLTTCQLRTVGELSRRYGRDVVAITGQQHIRLRWTRVQDVPAVIARLRAAGLSVVRAGDGASPAFIGSPVAGIAADEIIDGSPALRGIRERSAARAALRGLPGKFRTTVSGSPRQDVLHEAGDVSFVGVCHPDLGPGFDVWIGAGLSAGPALAGRLGAFAALDEVPAVWAAIAGAYRDHGYRRPGRRDLLASLVTDRAAVKFRQVIETEYLHRPLADGPAPPPAWPRDHVGVHLQRDGRCYVGVTPSGARARGSTLTGLADLAEAHGSTRVRATPYQKLIVLDIPPGRVESLCDGLERIGLTARPGLYRHRWTGTPTSEPYSTQEPS
ncbi:MAG TPA: nitrite/sulfite reductase [Trebonia sp.]